MLVVAGKLSDDEIVVVSSYFASLAPAKIAAHGAGLDKTSAPTGVACDAVKPVQSMIPHKGSFTLPGLSTVPKNPFGDRVRLGYDIFTHT